MMAPPPGPWRYRLLRPAIARAYADCRTRARETREAPPGSIYEALWRFALRRAQLRLAILEALAGRGGR